MQKTNTKPTNLEAISSARIPGAHRSAAVSTPSPNSEANLDDEVTSSFELDQGKVVLPPIASGKWGFAAGGASSSDEEEEDKKKKKKQSVKGAPAKRSKKKSYLVSDPQEEELMSGTAAPDFDDELPSAFDPFADARAEDAAGDEDYVHLRVQQRNGRKSLTTVQGLSADFNYAKVLRDLKKELCCNGVVVPDKELGQVIQLQGDHRKTVAAFLEKAGLVKKDNIKVHGI